MLRTYYLKENNCLLSNALNFFWKLFALGTLCFKGLLKLSKKYISTVITFLFILGVILKFYGLDSPYPSWTYKDFSWTLSSRIIDTWHSIFFLTFQVIMRQSCTPKADVWAIGKQAICLKKLWLSSSI